MRQREILIAVEDSPQSFLCFPVVPAVMKMETDVSQDRE
jgi:hypothetical protein